MLEALEVMAVLLSGTVAGLLVGTGMNEQTLTTVPPASWIDHRRASDRLFGRVMPPVLIISVLLPAVAAGLSAPVRLWFAGAVCGAIGVIAITRVVHLPLNKRIEEFDRLSPPTGWRAVQRRWIVAHWFRAALASLAFGVATMGLAMSR